MRRLRIKWRAQKIARKTWNTLKWRATVLKKSKKKISYTHKQGCGTLSIVCNHTHKRTTTTTKIIWHIEFCWTQTNLSSPLLASASEYSCGQLKRQLKCKNRINMQKSQIARGHKHYISTIYAYMYIHILTYKVCALKYVQLWRMRGNDTRTGGCHSACTCECKAAH